MGVRADKAERSRTWKTKSHQPLLPAGRTKTRKGPRWNLFVYTDQGDSRARWPAFVSLLHRQRGSRRPAGALLPARPNDARNAPGRKVGWHNRSASSATNLQQRAAGVRWNSGCSTRWRNDYRRGRSGSRSNPSSAAKYVRPRLPVPTSRRTARPFGNTSRRVLIEGRVVEGEAEGQTTSKKERRRPTPSRAAGFGSGHDLARRYLRTAEVLSCRRVTSCQTSGKRESRK